MTRLPLSSGLVPRFFHVLIALAALVSQGAEATTKADLQPGQTVEREIGGAESHAYRLPLGSDTYLRLRVDQPVTDMVARLVTPRGREIRFFEEPQRFDAPDRLLCIVRRGGEYRLIVQPRDPRAARGRYRLTLQELRPASPRDAAGLAAEADYTRARRLLATGATKEVKTQSLELFQRALRRWRTVGDRIGEVDARVQIGEIQSGLGHCDAALAAVREALRQARQARYPEGEARALASVGDCYNRSGDKNNALNSFHQALDLWKACGDPNWQGLMLLNIGQLEENPETAWSHLEQAQTLLHAAGNAGEEANVETSQGILSFDRGDLGRAQEKAERALELSGSARNDLAKASALQLLGKLNLPRGELDKALLNFGESVRLYAALGDSDGEAYSRQGLGSAYFNLGDPDRTLAEYGRALGLTSDVKLKARLLLNTGYIHQQAKRDPETALRYYHQALELSNTSGKALAFQYIGTTYVTRGNAREGLGFLLESLELRRGIKEISRQPNSLLEIGTAYRALGDPRRAADSYRQALRLSQGLGNTDLQAECLYRWALLDRGQGRLNDALRRIQESVRIVESVRSQVAGDKLRTSFFATKRAYYELLMNLLAQLAAAHHGRYLEAALAASDRARARSLRDLLAEGNVRAGIPPELQKRDVELRSRLSWLQGRKEMEAAITQVQDAMEQLSVEIRNSYQQYAAVRYPTPLRAGQIRELVGERAALLHYFVGEEKSFLFVVTRRSVTIHPLPGAAELSDRVAQLRGLIQKRGLRYLPAYRQAAAGLYSLLVGPAAAALQGKSLLLIAPDGPLHRLPFEALLTADQGRSYDDLPYLLRGFAVSYAPAASVLADLQKSQPAASPGKSFLAFADPAYGRSAAGSTRGPQGTAGLARLPESRQEVQRIAALYPESSTLYVGPDAKKGNVERNSLLANARRVHFALHGTIDERRPERSGLELADGRLQVLDIFNLKLSADLLTLSACDTAGGKEVHGEGIIGLTRAFLYAGAHSIVVSLWPVVDRSTPQFMYDMYRNLGSGKAEALRRTKLTMIASWEFSEPYYWAPFTLSGDPR